MKVKDPVVWNISLLHCDDVCLAFAIKTSGGQSSQPYCPTVKEGSVWNFWSKYRLYLACWFVKGLDALSCMPATCCNIFWRSMLRVILLAASSSKADWTVTVVDPGGDLQNTRLNTVLSVKLWIWELYAYICVWTKFSRFRRLLAIYRRSRDAKFLS